jgi:hypothetical protein
MTAAELDKILWYSIGFYKVRRWSETMTRESFAYHLRHWLSHSPFGTVTLDDCRSVFDKLSKMRIKFDKSK